MKPVGNLAGVFRLITGAPERGQFLKTFCILASEIQVVGSTIRLLQITYPTAGYFNTLGAYFLNVRCHQLPPGGQIMDYNLVGSIIEAVESRGIRWLFGMVLSARVPCWFRTVILYGKHRGDHGYNTTSTFH